MGKNQQIRCAGCAIQKRRCGPQCPLAPFFPADRMEDFEAVSRIFGAANFIRLMKSTNPHQQVAAKSLITEAKARIADPIFGISGTVYGLSCQLKNLRSELVLIKQQKEFPCRRNTLLHEKVGSSSSPTADALSVAVSVPSTSLQQFGGLEDSSLPAASVNKSCGACRYKKKKCLPECPFSPFFPLNKMEDFENVVKVFGAEKFIKLIKLGGILEQLAADTMIFEANTRIRNPVLGVVGIVESLSQHVNDITSELASIKQQNIFHLKREPLLPDLNSSPSPLPLNKQDGLPSNFPTAQIDETPATVTSLSVYTNQPREIMASSRKCKMEPEELIMNSNQCSSGAIFKCSNNATADMITGKQGHYWNSILLPPRFI